eukprot:615902-Pyramimonas_sp.AAC.1
MTLPMTALTVARHWLPLANQASSAILLTKPSERRVFEPRRAMMTMMLTHGDDDDEYHDDDGS